MDETTRNRRVQALLNRPLIGAMTEKRHAVRKLLKWQPGARRIRFDRQCPERRCKSRLMMSYVLTDDLNRETNPDMESCGAYCPRCGFGGSSRREKKFQRG